MGRKEIFPSLYFLINERYNKYMNIIKKIFKKFIYEEKDVEINEKDSIPTDKLFLSLGEEDFDIISIKTREKANDREIMLLDRYGRLYLVYRTVGMEYVLLSEGDEVVLREGTNLVFGIVREIGDRRYACIKIKGETNPKVRGVKILNSSTAFGKVLKIEYRKGANL